MGIIKRRKLAFILLIVVLAIVGIAYQVGTEAPGYIAYANESLSAFEVRWTGTFESEYGSSIAADISATYVDENGVSFEANVIGLPDENDGAGQYILIAEAENGDRLANAVCLYVIKPKAVEVVWEGSYESVFGASIADDIKATYIDKDGQSIQAAVAGLPQAGANIGSYVLKATTVDSNYSIVNGDKVYVIKDNSESEIRDLTEQIGALKETLNGLEAQLESLNETNKGLQADLDEQEELLLRIETENATLKDANQSKLIAIIVLPTLLGLLLLAGAAYILTSGRVKRRNKQYEAVGKEEQEDYSQWQENYNQEKEKYTRAGYKINLFKQTAKDIRLEADTNYNERGLQYDYSKFTEVIGHLEDCVYKAIDSLPDYNPEINSDYDPQKMEEDTSNGYGDGGVSEVLKQGKRCGDTVVRKAKVLRKKSYVEKGDSLIPAVLSEENSGNKETTQASSRRMKAIAEIVARHKK